MAVQQMDPAPVILVVDDEPIVLRLMARILADAGFAVRTADSALSALGVIAELPTPPAAVVSDLRMDPIDGYDLAKLVEHEWPGVPVLLVSGWDPDHPIIDRPFLRKPFRPLDLVDAVARLLPAAVERRKPV
jgi:DNA-binding NtrC family response regulator